MPSWAREGMAVMSHKAGSSGSAKVEVVKWRKTMISKAASESGGGAERRVGGRSRFKKTLVQAAKDVQSKSSKI